MVIIDGENKIHVGILEIISLRTYEHVTNARNFQSVTEDGFVFRTRAPDSRRLGKHLPSFCTSRYFLPSWHERDSALSSQSQRWWVGAWTGKYTPSLATLADTDVYLLSYRANQPT